MQPRLRVVKKKIQHKNYILKYHKRPKKILNTSKNYIYFFVFRLENHNYNILGEKKQKNIKILRFEDLIKWILRLD